MIVLSDIKDYDSGCDVTSEAIGYELENALDYEKPWLKWRSTNLDAQLITLNYSGSIDCVVMLGANFDTMSIGSAGGWGIDGWGEEPGWGVIAGSLDEDVTLGYLRILGEYRGLFSFVAESDSIQISIPNQACDDSYFTIGGILIGTKTDIAHKPLSPLDKELVLPVSEISLESKTLKKAALGRRYHIIKLPRRGMDITALNEFRDIKRAKGKKDPFVIYENNDETEKVFLVKRTEDFAYSKKGYHDYQDDFVLEEIA